MTNVLMRKMTTQAIYLRIQSRNGKWARLTGSLLDGLHWSKTKQARNLSPTGHRLSKEGRDGPLCLTSQARQAALQAAPQFPFPLTARLAVLQPGSLAAWQSCSMAVLQHGSWTLTNNPLIDGGALARSLFLTLYRSSFDSRRLVALHITHDTPSPYERVKAAISLIDWPMARRILHMTASTIGVAAANMFAAPRSANARRLDAERGDDVIGRTVRRYEEICLANGKSDHAVSRYPAAGPLCDPEPDMDMDLSRPSPSPARASGMARASCLLATTMSHSLASCGCETRLPWEKTKSGTVAAHEKSSRQGPTSIVRLRRGGESNG
ncbi:uncharacterized protein MAM_04033 [Metarhizium album ARSEF 1941]|uniref:Uncharacterized protein n=1 Tax=Metarhizium album (strain ARSEF 1941) TaxID=1081103 RepID=A0A0B2WY07_METAS|nr:uncharacterized protein MAM_04033 [Metarhizium album ARSEF 1941]KHN98272.1 hypothetical protein MAM_04033 [Metarhizium album ARSEF 1941]